MAWPMPAHTPSTRVTTASGAGLTKLRGDIPPEVNTSPLYGGFAAAYLPLRRIRSAQIERG